MSHEVTAVHVLSVGRREGGSAQARAAEFSAFFEAHERRLRAFAMRRTGDPLAADDLVAETMAIAWNRFDDLSTPSPFGWLCGIAIRVQANETRIRRRQAARVERAAAEAETQARAAGLEADRLLPEQREAIEAALDRLHADDREVLALAVWDGLADGDIAVALGITPAAARKRLSRARQRFRDAYARITGEPPTGTGGG